MPGVLIQPREDTAERKWSPTQTAGLVLVVSALLWAAIIWLFVSLVF